VDDHSPEPLEDIVREFEDKLHIKYVYAEENGGPGVARQIGLEICYESNFDLVMFMDSDDLLYPHTISRLTYEINHNQADVVSSAIWVEKKNSTGNLIEASNKTWLHGKIFKTKYLKENNIAFPKIRTNEDLAFNLMAIENSNKSLLINEPLYLFRDESSSITRCGENMGNLLSIDYIQAIYCASKFLIKTGKFGVQMIINIVACYNYYQAGLCLGISIPKETKVLIKELLKLPQVKETLNTPNLLKQYSNIFKHFFVHNKQIYYHPQTFKQWIEEFTDESSND
jgi:glycosyltransferase involved in cell wall biosynthesis